LAVGISKPTLQRYLTAQTGFDFETIVRLCDCAGARISWLISGLGPWQATDDDERLDEAMIRDCVTTVLTAAKPFPSLTEEDLAEAILKRYKAPKIEN
jgi:ribosomal protein L14